MKELILSTTCGGCGCNERKGLPLIGMTLFDRMFFSPVLFHTKHSDFTTTWHDGADGKVFCEECKLKHDVEELEEELERVQERLATAKGALCGASVEKSLTGTTL